LYIYSTIKPLESQGFLRKKEIYGCSPRWVMRKHPGREGKSLLKGLCPVIIGKHKNTPKIRKGQVKPYAGFQRGTVIFTNPGEIPGSSL